MDIFGLVEASLQEQRILGDTQKKEITGFHRFKDLAVKGFDILLEEVVSARVELPRLDSAHESGHKLLHGAWQGVIRFALVSAHPYPGSDECGKKSLIEYVILPLMSMTKEPRRGACSGTQDARGLSGTDFSW